MTLEACGSISVKCIWEMLAFYHPRYGGIVMDTQAEKNKRFKDCATLLGVSVEELENKVTEALGTSPQTMTVAELESEDGAKCVSVAFYDVLSLDLCFDYTAGKNWNVRLWGTLKLLGNPVARVEYTLDANHLSFTLPVNVWVAKAEITIDIRDVLRMCLYAAGEACYWNFPAVKWSCAKFDQMLFCFLN